MAKHVSGSTSKALLIPFQRRKQRLKFFRFVLMLLSVNYWRVSIEAFKYSVPVLLGCVTIGIAFGFMVSGAGYPWWIAFVMCFWMFAGAGQFIALALFAAWINLWQACLIQLVVNVRHITYGLPCSNASAALAF